MGQGEPAERGEESPIIIISGVGCCDELTANTIHLDSNSHSWAAQLRTAIKGKHVDTLVGELRDGVLKAGASDNAEVEIYRSTACVLIMFDITSYQSYVYAIKKYYKNAKKLIPESTIILVAAKSDLTLKQAVEVEEIERFCVKEGIFFAQVSVLTKMSISMLETMIKIQILGLLRANEGDMLYDLEELLVVTKGDIDAEFFLKHHDDSHLRHRARHISVFENMDVHDGHVTDAFDSLAVPERDHRTIDGTLGTINSDPMTDVEATGDALVIALKNLQGRVEFIKGELQTEEEKRRAQEEAGNHSAGVEWEQPPDIDDELMREAFGMLGRAAPPRPPSAPLQGRRGGRASTRERESKAKSSEGGKKKAAAKAGRGKNEAELRIKVGLPGGRSALLEVYPGDHVVEVAKNFISDNGLPDTEHVTESLCKKIILAGKKKAELSIEQEEKVNTNKMLGRMEVELSNGMKRSIVLREGDDPALIVEAFSSRHIGQVSSAQKRELVKLLKGELESRKLRVKRG